MWRISEGKDTRWLLPAESDAPSHSDGEQADSTADAPFFETSHAPAEKTYEVPTAGELLFELGVIFSIIVGLCLLIEILLVAYGVPKV